MVSVCDGEMFAVCSKTSSALSFQIQTQISHHYFANVLTVVSLACPDSFLISGVSCLPSSCRHATISKFFGDKLPNCAGACDYCRNPKAVRAQLERAAALSTKIEAQSKEPKGAFGFQPSLYEGGKKGYGFERQDAIWNVWFVPLGFTCVT